MIIESFKSGVPNLSDRDSKALFDAVKKVWNIVRDMKTLQTF